MDRTPTRRARAIRAMVRAAFHTTVAIAAIAVLTFGVQSLALLGWWAVCLVAVALTAVYLLSTRTV